MENINYHLQKSSKRPLNELSNKLPFLTSNDEDLSSPEGGDQSPNPNQYVLTVTAGEGGSVSTQGGIYNDKTLKLLQFRSFCIFFDKN